MTGVAPEGETGHAPMLIPAPEDPFAGETPGALGDVQIAYLHNTRVSHSWHASLMALVAYDKTVGPNVLRRMPFAVFCSGPQSLVEGRNLAVQHFLDDTDSEWLMFIDTDMGFQPEYLERLLFAADPTERPIVGGLCFAMKHVRADNHGGYRVQPMPTLFSWAVHPEQGLGFATRFRYPPETLVQVAGTGGAFLLIHRSVLVDLREEHGDTWFDLLQYNDGTNVSEDLSFCRRAGEAGHRIFVHTGVKVTHHKEVWLGEASYDMPEVEPYQASMDAAKQLIEEVRGTGWHA